MPEARQILAIFLLVAVFCSFIFEDSQGVFLLALIAMGIALHMLTDRPWAISFSGGGPDEPAESDRTPTE